ncbi:MAG: signal recognition particle-docking protein FtsY [Alphaproteobacteria bacterium]|nr:signal recognition particle-docking protein FtsY [Alphaproteobacteria bacterium]
MVFGWGRKKKENNGLLEGGNVNVESEGGVEVKLESEVKTSAEVVSDQTNEAIVKTEKTVEITSDVIDSVKDEAEVIEKKVNWFTRLKMGLSRSSNRLSQGITDIFTKRKLDDEAIEELEDLLITADIGIDTVSKITSSLAKDRFDKEVSPEEVKKHLSDEIEKILYPVATPLEIKSEKKPHVVLMVGVNGAGKTTTLGKMAKQYIDNGKKVTLVAADTFRAAAVEQLKAWGDRTGAPVVSRQIGADAAGLVFDALFDAKDRGDDVLLIDTAGRLQNKSHLMEELQKIVRVIKKIDPEAPHTTLLVLDATVGQNAHSQVQTFLEMADINGLVMTKLDGTAKGGVVVALAEKFGLPIHFIGVGESVEDLHPFQSSDYAKNLVGL